MIKRLRELIYSMQGKLAYHSSLLLGWMLLRTSTQVATIILLTNILGVVGYGKIVSILAVTAFLVPFIGLGLSNILLRNGARDPENLPAYFRRALFWWAVTLFPVTLLSIILFEILLPDGLPRFAVYAVITVELWVASLTELCARYRQAAHKISSYGAITAGLPIIRLLSLCVLLIFQMNTVEFVLWLYVVSGLVYLLMLSRLLRLNSDTSTKKHETMPVMSGLPLSLSAFAMRLQGEFNKPILAQTGFELAGSYNAAQRAIDLAALPLQAIQESLWPYMYAHANPRQIFRMAAFLLSIVAIMGAVSIWFAAPLIPIILGHDFDDAINIARYLVLLPLLQSFRALANFQVIQRNLMKLIGWSCAAGAFVGVIGVSFLVPKHGVLGAVISAYLSEVVMVGWLLLGMKTYK